MVLPGLEPHNIVGCLIEEHGKSFAVTRNRPDQREWRLLLGGRWWRRCDDHDRRASDSRRGRAARWQEDRALARCSERRNGDAPEGIAGRIGRTFWARRGGRDIDRRRNNIVWRQVERARWIGSAHTRTR